MNRVIQSSVEYGNNFRVVTRVDQFLFIFFERTWTKCWFVFRMAMVLAKIDYRLTETALHTENGWLQKRVYHHHLTGASPADWNWNCSIQIRFRIRTTLTEINIDPARACGGNGTAGRCTLHGCRSVSLWWRIPFTNVSEWWQILHQCFSSENDPSPIICGRSFTKHWWRILHQPFCYTKSEKCVLSKGWNIYMVGIL